MDISIDSDVETGNPAPHLESTSCEHEKISEQEDADERKSVDEQEGVDEREGGVGREGDSEDEA